MRDGGDLISRWRCVRTIDLTPRRRLSLPTRCHPSTVSTPFIYVLLIMHYFKRGGLPEDEAALRRIVRATPLIWRQQSPPVMALFHYEEGAWRHTRIDAERAAAARVSAVRAAAGREGAAARWPSQNRGLPSCVESRTAVESRGLRKSANSNGHQAAEAMPDDGFCHSVAMRLPCKARATKQDKEARKGGFPLKPPLRKNPLNPPEGGGTSSSSSQSKVSPSRRPLRRLH